MRTEQPVDPRGPRFAAWITTVVLAVVLITGWWPLLAAQAVVFAVSAVRIRANPYGLAFRSLIAPRLGRSTEREDAAPLRFAQSVGLVFALVGVLGYAAGFTVLGVVATACALAAAFLNAAFGFCLGCQMYLLLRQITARAT